MGKIQSDLPVMKAEPGGPGSTEILKWKDGKKGVFLLCFDDSAPTLVEKVIPEIQRRGILGTFYNIPGCDWHRQNQEFWDHPLPGIEYGNHTYGHGNIASAASLEVELRKAGEEIDKCFPGRETPRLISFAKPGGVSWSLSEEEAAEILAKYHLIQRPPFRGYGKTIQTHEEVVALPSKAVREGEMEYLNFHGVGGDWLSTPWDIFCGLLDALERDRDRIWITDPVSWHQYATERAHTTVESESFREDWILVRLKTLLDTRLYNLPLTLSTRVPGSWKACRVVQEGRERKIPISGGEIVYEAVPGSDSIVWAR